MTFTAGIKTQYTINTLQKSNKGS